MKKTDEVVVSLKINNKQAAASLAELEEDARVLVRLMRGLNPEADKESIEKIKKQYNEVRDRIGQVKEEVGLLTKKVETPIDPKSLSGLEKKAGELKKGLAEINPEVDKAKFDKLKAEYDGVQAEIDQTKVKMGLLEKKIETPIDPKSLSGLEKKASELKKDLSALNPEVDKAKFEKLKAEYDGVQAEIDQTKKKLGMVKDAEKGVETGANQIREAFKQMMTAAFWIALIQQAYELAKAFFEVQKEINGLQVQIAKFTGATGKELDQLVGKTQGIAKAFEVEAKEVNDAANSIAKNMKISFGEAQDLIKKGLAASAETYKGELLSWYEEYASALSGSKMKAEEFVAFISSMKEQGIYNDFGIDALKEFEVRMSRDTPKIIEALKTVEQATGKTFAVQMVKDLETGKIGVTDALKVVSGELAKLPETSNIAKQAVTAVFGSKGEDIGVGVLQKLGEMSNATDYLNQSTKAHTAQLDQLIESQQTLTATQSELFGKMQSGTKSIEILTAQALTLLYKLLILIVENSKPLVDVWEKVSLMAQNFYTELNLVIKSMGLAGKEGTIVKETIELIAKVLSFILLPARLFWSLIVGISESVRTSTGRISAFWQALQLVYPSLTLLKPAFQAIIDLILFLPRAIGSAIEALDQWLDKSEAARRKIQDMREAEDKYEEERKNKEMERLRQSEEAHTQAELAKLEATKAAHKGKSQSLLDWEEKKQKEREKEAKEAQKAADDARKAAEELAKELAAIERKLQDARLKAIADAEEQKIKQLELSAQREIEEFNKSIADDEQKAEYRRLIEQKLFEEIYEIRQKALDEELKRQEEIERAEQARAEAIINAEKERLSLEQQKIALQLKALAQSKPQSETEDQTAYLAEKYRLEKEQRQLELDEKLLGVEEGSMQEFLIKEEFRLMELESEKAHNDAILAEKFRVTEVQIQTTQKMFGAMKETTQAIVELFGEQTEAGRVASAAMKAFSAGEIIANSIVEVSNAWKNASANPINALIPGAGNVIAAVQTAGILARKTKNLGELASIKFAQGGFLRGRSHAEGGIKGTGRFSNIEVEGGEFITNKRATALNLPVLDAINKYGDKINFSHMISFATGGQLPSTTPSPAVEQALRLADSNPQAEMMLQAIIEMGEKLDSYEREKQVIVNYSNIETAADKMAAVREY